jgi:hypothetical protein
MRRILPSSPRRPPRNRVRRPSPATVLALIALVMAMSGTAYALTLPKNSVGSKQIKKNAVTSSKIKKGAVTSSRVKNGSLLKKDFKSLPGSPGPQGPKGEQGPPGSPAASMITGNTTFDTPPNIGEWLVPSGQIDSLGGPQLSPNTTMVARDLAFQTDYPPGFRGSASLKLYANEMPTSVGCTISWGGTSCNSGAATATIPPGSPLNMVLSTGYSTNIGKARWGFRVLAP